MPALNKKSGHPPTRSLPRLRTQNYNTGRRDEVVPARADDLDRRAKFASAVSRGRIALGQEDDRRRSRAPGSPVEPAARARARRRPVDHHARASGRRGTLARRHHPLLQAHDTAAARLFRPRRHIVVEREGRGAFFVRVGEHADVVEPVIGDEVAQLVDVRVGFAGEADDERRPQRDARDRARGFGRGAGRSLARARAASSASSTASAACCSGRSMYLQTLSQSAIASSVVVVDGRRIEVEQPDPLEAVDRVQLAQAAGRARRARRDRCRRRSCPAR